MRRLDRGASVEARLQMPLVDRRRPTARARVRRGAAELQRRRGESPFPKRRLSGIAGPGVTTTRSTVISSMRHVDAPRTKQCRPGSRRKSPRRATNRTQSGRKTPNRRDRGSCRPLLNSNATARLRGPEAGRDAIPPTRGRKPAKPVGRIAPASRSRVSRTRPRTARRS